MLVVWNKALALSCYYLKVLKNFDRKVHFQTAVLTPENFLIAWRLRLVFDFGIL